MNKLTYIALDGFKNATFVFFVFYFVNLGIETFNSADGLSLMLKAKTYRQTLYQPLIIGLYFFILVISMVNSYKKITRKSD